MTSSEMEDSSNPERRDRKKYHRLHSKENKTPEDIRKIRQLEAKITYYDNLNKLRERKPTGCKCREETDDEFLNSAYNTNKEYWEKEYERQKQEAIKNKQLEEEMKKKRREENEKERREANEKKRREATEKKRREANEKKRREANEKKRREENALTDIQVITSEIHEMGGTIPEEITEFLDNEYTDKKRRKLYGKYHPDKHKNEIDLYNVYAKLIGAHKDTECKSSGLY
jgi:hypothetical protein